MPRENLDTRTAAGSSPVPRAFTQVGYLLSHSHLWGDWLAEHPDKAELFKEAFSCVVRLESHTGWSADVVLERLGCDTKTEDELSSLTEERLASCLAYMRWVESLLGEHDLALDKRLILQGAARVFVAADRDLDCIEALMGEGEFSPLDYLRLGEVAEAWKSALRLLDGPAGDRARRLHRENPFFDENAPHLSPMRLAMLSRSNATELLGERTEERMREHLELCHVCGMAQRRAAAAPSRRPVAASL
jgi:hypothetical protein